MVDVRQVRVHVPGSEIDVHGMIVIPVRWTIAHRALGNLRLTKPVTYLLESKKVSLRLYAEMLVQLDHDPNPDWAKYEWCLIDLKTHHLIGLDTTKCNSITFGLEKKSVTLQCGCYRLNNDGSVHSTFGSAITESEYNKDVKRLFGNKFPVMLVTMHPTKQNAELKGVPLMDQESDMDDSKVKPLVEQAKESATPEVCERQDVPVMTSYECPFPLGSPEADEWLRREFEELCRGTGERN